MYGDDVDFLYDDLEYYQNEIEDHNEELSDLEDEVSFIKDAYMSKLEEIDEYWDKENQYIINSGIYTKEEVQQILAEHEEVRRNQKAEAKKEYEESMEILHGEKEQVLLDKEMAEFSRDSALDDIELAKLERDTEWDDENFDVALRKQREEQAAYDDFIASLDMGD